MYKYDVSIIIPVYNNEQYIEECVNSILEQDYNLNKIQIILINDGSTDNSLNVCNQLAKQCNIITVINQENQGVSTARNNGIKAAEGKYIMFLDSDDFISKNAIRELIEFFDQHYDDIDLITYPIYNYNNTNQKTKKLKRYEILFDNTGIYDLKEDYDIVQTTINIMVKNMKEDNKLFDIQIFFHEDLKYNIEVLYRKQKLGYVDSAIYYYRKFDNSTTNIKDNPLYTFEQYTTIFHNLLNTYIDQDGKSLKYVQSTILNTLRWRLEQDKLFPYHMEWKDYFPKFKSILDKIDNEVIVNDKQMNQYHKMYFINLKDKDNIHIYQDYNNQKATFAIQDKDHILFIEDKVQIVMNRFKVINNKIKILGYIKSPLLEYCESELYVHYVDKNNEIHQERVELSDSSANYFRTNIEVAKFKKFEIQFDINEVKNFQFIVYINHKKMANTLYFNKYTPFCEIVKNYKFYSNEYRIECQDNEFSIMKYTIGTKIRDFITDLKKYAKINNRINIYRILGKLTKKKNKEIWLYYDRIGIFDNAYFQFKHDMQKKDHIKKYYILDGNKKECTEKFTKRELKNVVKFGSIKHKLLFLNCNKILTSFSSLQEYCPLCKNYQYYKDMLQYELIYLQHGILHANLLKMYSKEFTPIDKFVISSEFEKNNLINHYYYSEEDLIPVGMPRLEEENNHHYELKNKIIYAPSWREYLIGKAQNRTRIINKTKFMNSRYYTEIIKFLSNPKLNETLKDKNLTLDFKLHPIFREYKECFESIVNENIHVSIGDTHLEEYQAFITDFSSFQFDFIKLNRPILYFLPDIKEFKAGLHTYRKLDLKYEEAFGKLCLTGEELVQELLNIIHNNYSVEKLYQNRMETFFYDVKDKKEKLYQILKEENK